MGALMDYVSTLLPSFTKSRLTEDVSLIQEEIKDKTLPPYVTAAKAFSVVKFQSPAVKGFEDEFRANVKTKFRGNSLVIIEQTLQLMIKNADVVKKSVDAYYSDDVMREAMTFLKVNLMQYIEVMGFVSKYARHHLRWVIASEQATVSDDPNYTDFMLPAEVEWLQVHRQHFINAISIMGGFKSEEVETNFQSIPDIVATKDNIPVIEKTVGVQKTDPFAMNLIPVKWNPIYHIRMNIAQYQVKKFKAAQQEKEVLEMRLLQLKQKQQGRVDPRLQQQIEYEEGRLQKLNYELKQMEEEYA